MVKKRSAFTMIELVMVIVVLGIVASIGADIIASLYSNYLRVRTINRLEAQTEITLEQIAKRLQYRIKDSVIARKTTGAYLALSNSNVDDTYTTLEWIGYSNESLLGTPPGWSGFIDLNSSGTSSTAKTLNSPESNLTFAADTISALTDDVIDLTAGKEAALIFKVSYDAEDFGWGIAANSEGTATIKVYENNSTAFKITSTTLPDTIYEQYDLAHSAYAIVPEGDTTTTPPDFNLTFYYNYQPWLNKEYTDGNSSVLAEHVSLFRFRQDQSIIHLKLCLHDANQTGMDDYITVCKEKVVY
jgi:prepilin-type N-terminal cleavage/methylation domain-containing protein